MGGKEGNLFKMYLKYKHILGIFKNINIFKVYRYFCIYIYRYFYIYIYISKTKFARKYVGAGSRQ